jgi:hypothetical protein
LGALAAAVAAGVCANAGKKANANRPSQSEIVRFIFVSLEAARTRLPAGSKNSCHRSSILATDDRHRLPRRKKPDSGTAAGKQYSS